VAGAALRRFLSRIKGLCGRVHGSAAELPFRPVRHWNCLEIQKRLRRLRHIVARLWQKTVDFQRLRVRHHDAPISLGFDALLSVEKMTGPFAIPSYSRPPSLT
jgi:hypothetical protein